MDRQKLILIFGGAFIGAALLTWLLFATTKAPKVDKMVTVTAVARDLPAGTRLKDTDLKKVNVVEKDLPPAAIADPKAAVGRALLFPVSQNDVLTNARLAAPNGIEGLPASIDPGKRAIAIPFTDATGVAGLIQPRAHVDVIFTRPGSLAEAVTTTVLEDVVVLAIGRNTEVTATPAPGTPGAAAAAASTPAPASSTQRAATLLVTPEQARKLEWAKNEGRLSLLLRNPLDRSVTTTTEPTTAYDLSLTSTRRRPGFNINNDAAWNQLTGQDGPRKPAPPPKKEEPPKPKFVVDVFRGDKHVQEIFQ